MTTNSEKKEAGILKETGTSDDGKEYRSIAIEVDENFPENSYEKSSLKIHFGNDGFLFLVDGNDMIYLYPAQVEHLKKILALSDI